MVLQTKERNMKKLIVLLSISFTFAASANEVVLSEKQIQINVDVSSRKVKLSQADNWSPVVKVLLPELAGATILDHRNKGEGVPCLVTFDTTDPKAVIQSNPGTENIVLNVKLTKETLIDWEGKCAVYLSESIEANIRGFLFTDLRAIKVGERHVDDCR